jgi:hypothetical protein
MKAISGGRAVPAPVSQTGLCFGFGIGIEIPRITIYIDGIISELAALLCGRDIFN